MVLFKIRKKDYPPKSLTTLRMKSIIQAMLEEIYTKADEIAKENHQTASESAKTAGHYFITLEQLERILKEFEQ